MSSKKDELDQILIIKTIDFLEKNDELDRDNPATNKLSSYLYIVDSKLSTYLETFKRLLDIESPNPSQLQERGKVLSCYAFKLGFLKARPLTARLVSDQNKCVTA